MSEEPRDLADQGIVARKDLGSPAVPQVEPLKIPYETESKVFTATTVAGTAVKVLEEDPARIVWSAINISDTDVYFGYDDQVAATGSKKGLEVVAGGGAIEDMQAHDEVWMICTLGGKEVTIQKVSKKGRREK